MRTFLIVERECDSCPAVRDIQVYNSTEGRKLLLWGGGENHRRWEVSYGPAGTPPGGGTVVQAAGHSVYLAGLSHDTDYVAYVRPCCKFAREQWGAWSDSVVVTFRAQGVEAAALRAEEVVLSPNPTRDRVRVSSPVAMERIELVGPRGEVLQTWTAQGREMTFDMGRHAAGSYLLVVHTPRGTVCRRVIRE